MAGEAFKVTFSGRAFKDKVAVLTGKTHPQGYKTS